MTLLRLRLLLLLALAAGVDRDDDDGGGGRMQKAVPRLSGSNSFIPCLCKQTRMYVCSPRSGWCRAHTR